MSLVKVYNDFREDNKEDVLGTMITIPANGFIEMTRAKAIRLLQQFTTPFREGDNGNAKPKMLRMVEDKSQTIDEIEVKENQCQVCTQSFNTSRELEVHGEMNHASQLLKEDKKHVTPTRRKSGK